MHALHGPVNRPMRRLLIEGNDASEILEGIYIALEQSSSSSHELSNFEENLLKRLKSFEVNNKEVYDNFYNTLAQHKERKE